MSEDDSEEVPEEAVEEDSSQDTQEDVDGQPDLSDEERAEPPADLGDVDPEEVEAQAGAGAGESDGDDSEGDTSDDSPDADSGGESGGESTAMEPSSSSAGEWGEMYVTLVHQTTNSIIEKHGDGHEVDKDHFTEEVPLDEYFNETLREMGHGTDMPPQQALVIGTAMAVGAPVVAHTDLLDEMLDGGELLA